MKLQIDNRVEFALDKILIRLANRTPCSPKNSEFYRTMRELYRQPQILSKNGFESKSVVIQESKKDKYKKRFSKSLSMDHKTNPEQIFKSTFVTIKNARYHLGQKKTYPVQNIEFPNFGNKSVRPKQLKPIIENDLNMSKQLSTNRSKAMDSTHLKMSWNRYMNITGFNKSSYQKQQIGINEDNYVNNIMGNKQKYKHRILRKNEKDKTEQNISGWKNTSYPEEQILLQKQ